MAKKKPITSIKQVAKRYAVKSGNINATELQKFTTFKNFGLDDLMQGVFAKTQQGATKVGVYLTKKQANKFSDVVNFAKGLGVEVGIGKAGIKNRPYDISVSGGGGGGGAPKTSATAAEDAAGISNKIVSGINKKRTKYGDY